MGPPGLPDQKQCESEGRVHTQEQEPGIANARERERIKAEPHAACGQIVAQAERLSIVNIVWVARRVADGAGNDLGGNHDFIEHCGVEQGIQQRVASPDNSTRDQHPAKRDTFAVMPDGIDSLRIRLRVAPHSNKPLRDRRVGLRCTFERRFVPGQVDICGDGTIPRNVSSAEQERHVTPRQTSIRKTAGGKVYRSRCPIGVLFSSRSALRSEANLSRIWGTMRPCVRLDSSRLADGICREAIVRNSGS